MGAPKIVSVEMAEALASAAATEARAERLAQARADQWNAMRERLRMAREMEVRAARAKELARAGDRMIAVRGVWTPGGD